MNNSNIKVYLGISFAMIILFILILVIPFTKKTATQNNTINPTNQPFPTSTRTANLPTGQAGKPTPITVNADFTGVVEEMIPQQVIDLAAQKKDLRQKTPLNLSTFSIDFDYGEDKFSVTLKDPKDQAQKEFESWRAVNYPGLNTNQFLLK